MKTMTCDKCEHQVQAESFEAWMEALKPHWKEAHADIMQEKMTLPKDQQMAEMMKWMQEQKARFEAL